MRTWWLERMLFPDQEGGGGDPIEDEPTESDTDDEPVEPPEDGSPGEGDGEPQGPVPYSRFKEVNDKFRSTESRIQELEQQVERERQEFAAHVRRIQHDRQQRLSAPPMPSQTPPQQQPGQPQRGLQMPGLPENVQKFLDNPNMTAEQRQAWQAIHGMMQHMVSPLYDNLNQVQGDFQGFQQKTQRQAIMDQQYQVVENISRKVEREFDWNGIADEDARRAKSAAMAELSGLDDNPAFQYLPPNIKYGEIERHFRENLKYWHGRIAATRQDPAVADRKRKEARAAVGPFHGKGTRSSSSGGMGKVRDQVKRGKLTGRDAVEAIVGQAEQDLRNQGYE